MATYNANAAASSEIPNPVDVWSWMSAAVRATSFVILLMLTLLYVTALFSSTQVHAQQVCGDRTAILKSLSGEHSEKLHSMGLSSDGKLIEVLVSSNGTWTMLVSSPNRVSCLAATGEHWELVEDVAFGPPA